MQKIFITSTGTNIGKSIFLNSLIRKLKNLDGGIKSLKPVISGFDFDEIPNDISRICESQEIEYNLKNINEISLYKFANPLSPDQAANLEGIAIDFQKLREFCNSNINDDFLLIEGVGGHQVPLTDEHTIMDLIKAINPDFNILIAGSYLGSLSHTISAIKNFQAEGVDVNLLVVTENLALEDELYIPSSETIKSIKNFFSGKILEINHKEGSFDDITNAISKEIYYDF